LPSVLGAESYAPDHATASRGYGSEVAVFGVRERWDLPARWQRLAGHDIDLRLDAQLARWRGTGRPRAHGSLWDVGLTPVLRWTMPNSDAAHLFVEGGSGVHALSTTRINDDRQVGFAFQIGQIARAGVAFGARGEYEVEVFVHHVSNADIKPSANWG
jgi:lipid A 3-O-deacylase